MINGPKNVSAGSNMQYMFANCYKMQKAPNFYSSAGSDAINTTEGNIRNGGAYRAFYECRNMTTGPNYVGSWNGYEVFYNCQKMSNIGTMYAVKMPNAFINCYNLRTVNLINNCYMTDLFRNCTGLVEVSNVYNCHYFNNTFTDCTSLTKVNITYDSYSYNHINTFRNCTSLTDFNGYSCNFYYCNDVFRGCTNLKNVYLPSQMNYFNGLFYDCHKLTNIMTQYNNSISMYNRT